MKGQYKTKNGSKVEVLDFDEANKMVKIAEGWVGEPEYSEWESLDAEQVEVAEETIELTEEGDTLPPEIIDGEVAEAKKKTPHKKKEK